MIKNIVIGLAFVCSVTALLGLMLNSRQQKFIYIDTLKVYSEFKYTKQVEKDLEEIVGARKNKLDSLYELVSAKTREKKEKQNISVQEADNVTRLQEDYFMQKERFEKENQLTLTNYKSKIWNQINELVSKYGKENNYTLIFGANGQGSVMYGDQVADKTNDIIDYLNKKYNDQD